MTKPRKRIQKNFLIRDELIGKGHIIPARNVPTYLKRRGFKEAAKAAAERLFRGLPLYRR